LGLTGEEVYSIVGLPEALSTGFGGSRDVAVAAEGPNGKARSYRARVRIDTPQEVLYYKHGGILQYVLRQLLGQK
jgi:aconitate hydratase